MVAGLLPGAGSRMGGGVKDTAVSFRVTLAPASRSSGGETLPSCRVGTAFAVAGAKRSNALGDTSTQSAYFET